MVGTVVHPVADEAATAVERAAGIGDLDHRPLRAVEDIEVLDVGLNQVVGIVGIVAVVVAAGGIGVPLAGGNPGFVIVLSIHQVRGGQLPHIGGAGDLAGGGAGLREDREQNGGQD